MNSDKGFNGDLSLFGIGIPAKEKNYDDMTILEKSHNKAEDFLGLTEEKKEAWHPKTEKEVYNEWLEEEKKMISKGFSSTGFFLKNNRLSFWSHYEEKECAFSEIESVLQYSNKSYGLTHGIILYDEYGQHTHTWMITKDFADFLIKDLKMTLIPKNSLDMPHWKNPSFIMGKSEELEIKKKSEELKELLKIKYGCEVTIKVLKK
jgi:hypothetical protein